MTKAMVANALPIDLRASFARLFMRQNDDGKRAPKPKLCLARHEIVICPASAFWLLADSEL
jgi:hypothetical protein